MNATRFFRSCFAVLLLTFASCATTVQVRGVLDLPPPENVRGVREDGRVTISWEAISGKPNDFTGYLLYYAERSLANVPLNALPEAIELPAIATQYSFSFADSLPVFVHVRSRAGMWQLSLPSLPEVALPPARE